MASLHPSLIVAYRQFLSWRTNWMTFILLRLVDPAIFFYGIGLGFGHFIPTIGGYPYLTYLLPGSLCMAGMIAGMLEGTYNAYIRCFQQRTWFSFVATPCRLHHILIGEVAWSAIRNLISSILLIFVGIFAGVHLDLWGTIIALPFIILTIVCITSVSLVCMSYARTMDDFNYVWALLMTPMMVFSGVMVSVDTFPSYIQTIVWALPLSHAIAIIRPLMLGYWEYQDLVIHGSILLIISTICFQIAYLRLRKSIFA